MLTETVQPHHMGSICGEYRKAGFRLQTMIATDERSHAGAFTLRYVFFHDAQRERVIVQSQLPSDDLTYQSATPFVPTANWYEREAYDLLGLVPVGHPSPEPLVLHGSRLANLFPLRKDFPLAGILPEVERTLAGVELPDGAFEVPVGPIHAGVIEPGHFRFLQRGESVESLTTTLFYTHRGLEKRAEGLSPTDGLALVEQTCGVCSVSHSLSYSQAVESLARIRIPERARFIRVVIAEMERLYNHIGDIGNICAGVGFSYGSMQGGRLKEILQRLNDKVTGHRYLRGMIAVGGVHRDLTSSMKTQIASEVQSVMQDFAGVVDALLSHEIVCDRFRNTGILSSATAIQLGVVGLAARASGQSLDSRVQQPYAGYTDLTVQVPTFPQGDVMARVLQRIQESYVSADLISQALSRLAKCAAVTVPADLCTPLQKLEPYAYGIGVSESPRGENVHFVMIGPTGGIERLRIRSASYANWPAVPDAVPGNLIADFPLINKSFELCYACCDR